MPGPFRYWGALAQVLRINGSQKSDAEDDHQGKDNEDGKRNQDIFHEPITPRCHQWFYLAKRGELTLTVETI